MDELVLIDEADAFVFSSIDKYMELADQCYLIGLTATTDSGDIEGTEALVMEAMGLKVFKNQIFKADRGDLAMYWEEK